LYAIDLENFRVRRKWLGWWGSSRHFTVHTKLHITSLFFDFRFSLKTVVTWKVHIAMMNILKSSSFVIWKMTKTWNRNSK